MKYCSECGHSIERRWIAEQGRERYVCPSCGLTYYTNPRVIVGCLVYCGAKILLCRRAQEPARGQWAIPAGFLECGETLEEGAARETLEETGVVVATGDLHLYSVVNMIAIEQVAVSFRVGFTSEPMIRCGSECLEVAFKAEHEISQENFAWLRSMGDAQQRFFRELRSNEFGIHMVTLGTTQADQCGWREYKIDSTTNAKD